MSEPVQAQVPVFDEIFIDGEPILDPPGGRPIEPEEVPLPAEDQDQRPLRPDPVVIPPTSPDAFTPNSPIRQQPAPFQFRPQSTAPLDTAYALDGGDVLQINVFDVPEYSGQYSVLADGTINMPLLGVINVRGLSIDEVTILLTEAYRTYLVRPFVNVTLIAARPMNLVVSGEVVRPGSYVSTAPSTRQFPTVTEALELAQGVTLAADIRNVELRRQTRRGEQFYVVNLWELVQNGDAAQDVTLRDGDSIFVPTATLSNAFDTQVLLKASFAPDAVEPIPVAVSGEVNRPGTYVVTPGNLTAAPQPPTITQAIAQAGGIKPSADIRNVRVRRRDRQNQEIILDINLWALLQEGDIVQDVPLQPNDAIIIPRAEVISPEDALLLANTSFSPDEIRVAVVGEVVSPGRLSLTPDTTLNQAILAAGGFNNTRAKKSSIDLLRLNPDGTVTNRRIDLDFTAGLNSEDNPLMRNGDVVVVNRNAFTGATDVLSALLSPIGEVFSVLNFFRAFNIIQVD